MKRYGNLYSRITDFSNLLLAARRAQQCKRFREDVLAFNYDLERNLHQLQYELRSKTYQPGNAYGLCKPNIIWGMYLWLKSQCLFKAGLHI